MEVGRKYIIPLKGCTKMGTSYNAPLGDKSLSDNHHKVKDSHKRDHRSNRRNNVPLSVAVWVVRISSGHTSET